MKILIIIGIVLAVLLVLFAVYVIGFVLGYGNAEKTYQVKNPRFWKK